MSALKIPGKMIANNKNLALCKKIGVKLNGRDLGGTCLAYDVAAGTALVKGGDMLLGAVEPYWR